MAQFSRICGRLAAVALVFSTVACGPQGNPPQTTTSTAAPIAAALPTTLSVESFHGAQIEKNGNAITVRRAQEIQGLTLRPQAGAAAQRLQFTVTGGAIVRAFRGKWFDLAAGESSFSVRIGPAGVFSVLIVPRPNSSAVVTVTNVTDCAQLSAGECPPVADH